MFRLLDSAGLTAALGELSGSPGSDRFAPWTANVTEGYAMWFSPAAPWYVNASTLLSAATLRAAGEEGRADAGEDGDGGAAALLVVRRLCQLYRVDYTCAADTLHTPAVCAATAGGGASELNPTPDTPEPPGLSMAARGEAFEVYWRTLHEHGAIGETGPLPTSRRPEFAALESSSVQLTCKPHHIERFHYLLAAGIGEVAGGEEEEEGSRRSHDADRLVPDDWDNAYYNEKHRLVYMPHIPKTGEHFSACTLHSLTHHDPLAHSLCLCL